jgi:hypothetical protein
MFAFSGIGFFGRAKTKNFAIRLLALLLVF